MSYVIQPDPYPGRCRNFRQHMDTQGIEILRCLGEDDQPHICWFPAVRVPAEGTVQYTWSPKEVKPWRSPEDRSAT